ncbi:MAG TPA: nicotinate phosphoribosyltransferase [Thermoanaerobacterales bacterium]|nr:nicotinate phosphoribosyltransferase [Thermoanaerobacterales bacterium]
MKNFEKLDDVKGFTIEKNRKLFSAKHEEIISGATTDIYFVKTVEILDYLNIVEKDVTAEVFSRNSGVLAGTDEVLNLLEDKDIEVWGLKEGEQFEPYDVVLRIKGPYREFAIYETPIMGILASSSGWATASKECRKAAQDKKFICFGARHIHPAVAPVMERAAVIGGADGASCILGAKLLGLEPSGTVPHAAFLIAGDTLTLSKAYDEIMPPDSPRIMLVDTFKDEVEETLRVAELLKERLDGIRLDTPSERGGVTPHLVREVRMFLDMKGHNHVQILVSGGITPERITLLREAGADVFGVGSYISGASPIDMTLDIKEIDGKPVAKRGRIPGITNNTKLVKFK